MTNKKVPVKKKMGVKKVNIKVVKSGCEKKKSP